MLITGYNQGNDGASNIWVQLVKEDGTSISKNLGGQNSDYGFDALESSDGNFLILGSTSSYGDGDYDIIAYSGGGNLSRIFFWENTGDHIFNEVIVSINNTLYHI